VRMRRRKPCVLARRRLFGWKVRLLTRFSVGCRGPSDVTTTSARLPLWGLWWPVRPQSASPWRAEVVRQSRARGHGHAKEVADTLGQRYGSPRTRVKPTEGARAPGSKPTILGGPAAIARRHAAERADCRRLDCHQRACGCRFSTLTILATPCTGCGQTCGQQGIVHQDTDGPRTSDPAGSSRCSCPTEPGTQQVQRN
jgi:hypothetical protein